MNALELLQLQSKLAKEYVKEASKSVVLNHHMNELEDYEEIEQKHIEAVVVDFINFMGRKWGIDYAMYTEDLKKE